jgi:hypothetical protein
VDAKKAGSRLHEMETNIKRNMPNSKTCRRFNFMAVASEYYRSYIGCCIEHTYIINISPYQELFYCMAYNILLLVNMGNF